MCWHVSVNTHLCRSPAPNCHISFVDRDMFMRYTQLGVGHPAMLRMIARDSLGNESPSSIVDAVDNSNSVALQGDVGYGEDSDGEGYEGYDDEKEVSDEEFSDEELEEEWEDEGSEIEDGCEEDGHEIEDEFDDLPSF